MAIDEKKIQRIIDAEKEPEKLQGYLQLPLFTAPGKMWEILRSGKLENLPR